MGFVSCACAIRLKGGFYLDKNGGEELFIPRVGILPSTARPAVHGRPVVHAGQLVRKGPVPVPKSPAGILAAFAPLGERSWRSARHAAPLLIASDRSVPTTAEVLARTSPAALAYLGDAIFAKRVREWLLWPPHKLNALAKRERRLVCAEGQAALLDRLVADFPLSEEESEWLRRGRNGSGRGPQRTSPATYRAATSFECLLGYLHYIDPVRLEQVLDFVMDAAATLEEKR